MTAPRHELEPARLRERCLAGVIDSGPLALLSGGVGMLQEWRPHALERLLGLSATMTRLGEWMRSPAGTRARAVLNAVAMVALRNTRSPGMRIMHIRRVDAGTGGPVALRSALRRAAFGLAWSAASKRLVQPTFARWTARATQVQAELDEVRRSHPDDPLAEARFYSAQSGNPAAGCCGMVVALVAIQELPVVLTPRRQTLDEWVAGTMMVRD